MTARRGTLICLRGDGRVPTTGVLGHGCVQTYVSGLRDVLRVGAAVAVVGAAAAMRHMGMRSPARHTSAPARTAAVELG